MDSMMNVVAALRDELARVTAERDALRGAVVALVTADAAARAALADQRTEEWTSAVERLDEAWTHARGASGGRACWRGR